jgi:threonine dehydrogenase-like Zn-dependent dehydrogenase
VCRNRRLLGVHLAGGFAEQVAVPGSALHDLPEGLADTAAALIEPLANAVHAWSLLRSSIEPVARIGVLGAGPIGLLCALVASRHGAAVSISDPSEHRRATAQQLGLAARSALEEEYDAVIDAVGLPATRRSSLDHTRPAGTAVWLGLAQDTTEISGNGLVRAELSIRGSFAYTPTEFAEAVDLAPALDLSWATAVPLEEAVEVFYSLADGNTEIVKAVLVPEHG